MLIYDTRYRSMTIQIIALIGFLLLLGALVSNTAQNLATLGKEPSFRFLGEPASYDINQRLLEYTSRDSHLRAAFVGLLNTLVVAVLGCITATVLGVLIGVLRLSNNWVVARLTAIYVEIFRNVPVLLWIVFTMAVMIETMDPPRAFKAGDATMSLMGSTAFSNQGIFVPRPVPADLGWVLVVVLGLSIFAISRLRGRADKIQESTGERPGIFLISTAVFLVPVIVAYFGISAFASSNEQVFVARSEANAQNLTAFSDEIGKIDYCHSSGKAASLNGLRFLQENEIAIKRRNYFNRSATVTAFEEGRCNLIAVPASSVDSFIADLGQSDTAGEENKTVPAAVIQAEFSEGRAVEIEYPAISEKGIPRFEGGIHIRNSLIALWLALSLYTAAFIAEIVRAGILAVSHGQTEAAAALGVRPGKIMSLVVLPQAMRVIIPPLISNYLNLTKNSSLAIAVGYMDITGTLMGITLNQTGRELETVLLTMLIYLAISLSISGVMNWYNERVKLVER
ncbi:ABC transporter permease subunit [Pseudophaeobacter sp.]|uniref:amino acid ABC transporter permease n=1 Tax=Pseudophaeobacter sp. TaxID=1971739 RepID=UPI00329A1E2F